MGLDFDFDLRNTTEKEVESGGRVVPGWYHAKVEDVYEDDKGSRPLVFHFKVLKGPYAGYSVFERLWDSDSDDEQKRKKAENRKVLFAKRLLLIQTDAFGNQVRGSFLDAIGRECAICVAERAGKDAETGQPTGDKFLQLKFDGIYQLNDERVPKELRQAGAPGTTGAGVPQKSTQPAPSMANAAAQLPAETAAASFDDF